jgi:hypothetical protein
MVLAWTNEGCARLAGSETFSCKRELALKTSAGGKEVGFEAGVEAGVEVGEEASDAGGVGDIGDIGGIGGSGGLASA